MDSFSFWVPMAKARPSDETDDAYRIRGIASTESRDWQGETVIQRGIDFSMFLKSGHFNWNHRPGPENIIGEPTNAFVTTLGEVPGYQPHDNQNGREPCFYLEGVLYKGMQRADDTWKLMTTMSKSGSSRSLGYSLEGGVAERFGKQLTKTIVRHCAITHEPINTDSWAAIAAVAKSFNSPYWDEFTSGEHHLFSDFGALVKSMTGQEGQLEPSTVRLSKAAVGLTPCTLGHHDGDAFVSGTDGMLLHLVDCEGWDERAAVDYVGVLQKALGG